MTQQTAPKPWWKNWRIWAAIIAAALIISPFLPDQPQQDAQPEPTPTASTTEAAPECTGKKHIDKDAALFPLENPHPNGEVKVTGCEGNIGAATVTVYHNSVTDGPSLRISGDINAIRTAVHATAPIMDASLTTPDIDAALDAMLPSQFMSENRLGALSILYVPAGTDSLNRTHGARVDIDLAE